MNSLKEILILHTEAADSFNKAIIALSQLKTEERRIDYFREILEEQISTAMKRMIEANSIIISLIKENN